jgi:hypothetical protein
MRRVHYSLSGLGSTTPTFCLKRELERIIGQAGNAKAGYEYVGDTRTRQKREDFGFEHHLSGTQKEVGIEIACSLMK